MSQFDPQAFLDSTTTEASIKRPPLPIGDYTALITKVADLVAGQSTEVQRVALVVGRHAAERNHGAGPKAQADQGPVICRLSDIARLSGRGKTAGLRLGPLGSGEKPDDGRSPGVPSGSL